MEQQRQRLWLVDGLRGIAALGVLLFHYLLHSAELYPELGTREGWAHLGFYGVHVFFVISGFVVFTAARDSTVRVFVRRRIIRLFPSYVLAVLLTSTVVAVFGLPGREVSRRDSLVNLTMLQEYAHVPHVDGVYWTLTIELFFYATLAVLASLRLLGDRALVWTVTGWLLAAVVTTRYVTTTQFPVHTVVWALGWAPLFVAGIGANRWWAGERLKGALMVGGALLSLVLIDRARIEPAAISVALVLVAATVRPPAWMRRPSEYLGNLSYPLYLVHQNIGYVMLLALAGAGLHRSVALSLTAATTIALGTAIAYWWDIPVRRRLTSAFASPRNPRG